MQVFLEDPKRAKEEPQQIQTSISHLCQEKEQLELEVTDLQEKVNNQRECLQKIQARNKSAERQQSDRQQQFQLDTVKWQNQLDQLKMQHEARKGKYLLEEKMLEQQLEIWELKVSSLKWEKTCGRRH